MLCYCVLLNGHLVGIYSSAADANTIHKQTPGSTVESCRLNSEVATCTDAGAGTSDIRQSSGEHRPGLQRQLSVAPRPA
eukprot:SAG22_NODE_20934_length_261_cov_0.950617_1_plen_78_part_01